MKTVQRFVLFSLALSLLLVLGCAGTETSRSTGTYVDDATISTKVKAQLATDSLTSAVQIEIETYNGVVQLSGFVDDQQTIDRAGEIARGVAGVKDVENVLRVR